MQKILITLLTLFLISCAYKIEIQQGNVITQAQVEKLTVGMDRRQVRTLLGTPLLIDAFHPDRWDYLYWVKKPGEDPQNERLSLFFEQGTLTRIEGEYEPGVEGEAQNLGEIAVDVPDHDSGGLFSRTPEAESQEKEE